MGVSFIHSHFTQMFRWTLGTATEVLIAWATLNQGMPGWRWMVGLGAAPFGVLLLAFPWVPESPKLLVAQVLSSGCGMRGVWGVKWEEFEA